MEKNYKVINIISVIIGLAIIASFIIVGSFLDYDISKALYNPEHQNFFAISGSIIAQMPTFLGVTFAGSLLLVGSKSEAFKEKKNIRIALIIGGIIFIALGTFFSYYYTLKLKDFPEIGKTTKYIIANVICLLVIGGINALIVLFTIKNSSKINWKKGLLVAFMILLIVGIEVLFYQALKIIISRPRPRYIFSTDEPRRLFQSWWDLSHPFKAFVDENCKSCPSGHSANAMALPFILVGITYLKKDTKFSFRLVMFLVGYVFALVWVISRIMAGAHFLSDLGLGMLISFLTGVIIWNFFVRKYKINKFEEEQPQVEEN